jgi:hypothetical protein
MDLIGSLAMIAASVSFNDARINREGFALDRAGVHARSYHRLEYLSEEVAGAEPAASIRIINSGSIEGRPISL